MYKAMVTATAVALFAPATAAPQAEPRRISLGEATALFAANSRELRAVRAYVDGVAATPRATGQSTNPTLGATHESLADGDRRAGETYVTLNQQLRWPWTISARNAAIRDAGIAARARANADSLELLHLVRVAYVTAWLAERRQEALERAAIVVRQARERGVERFRRGDLSGLDRRRLDMEGIRYDRLVTTGRLEVDSLRRMLGAAILAPGDSVTVAPAALDAPSTRVVMDTLQAMATHPAVVRARADLALASTEARYESKLVMPGPTLTAGYKHQDDGLAGLYVGASLPVPVFDRRGGAQAVAAAKVAAAEARLAVAERRVRDEARQAVARYAAALSLARSIPEPDPQQNVMSIALAAYDGGELDLTDLLTTAAAWRELGAQAHEIRAEYWLSRFELERAFGGTALIREEAQ